MRDSLYLSPFHYITCPYQGDGFPKSLLPLTTTILLSVSDKLLVAMSSQADKYAFPVIPENMHTGLIVFALPTYLTHFSR